MFFDWLLWLFILVQRVQAFLFFRMVLGGICLDFVCRHHDMCAGGKCFEATVSTLPSSGHWWILQKRLQSKSIFCIKFFGGFKTKHWGGLNLYSLQCNLLSVNNCPLFHVLKIEKTSDGPSWTDRTKYVLYKLLKMSKTSPSPLTLEVTQPNVAMREGNQRIDTLPSHGKLNLTQRASFFYTAAEFQLAQNK